MVLTFACEWFVVRKSTARLPYCETHYQVGKIFSSINE